MSAYIVQDKTINRVVTHIATLDDRDIKVKFAWALDDMSLLNHGGAACDRFAALVGLALSRMNVDAVNVRYPDPPTDAYGHSYGHYQYQPEVEPNLWQVLKSMQCLTYQCAEGVIQTSELYKALTYASMQLALHLVTHTPEYKQAEWA